MKEVLGERKEKVLGATLNVVGLSRSALAPIKEAAVGKVLKEKLEDLERMGERLKEIDSHCALFLLRHCFSIPKLTYFLRSAPCFKNPDTLQIYDNQLKECLQSILDNQLVDDRVWSQCSLPVAQGGLGIRRASEITINERTS